MPKSNEYITKAVFDGAMNRIFEKFVSLEDRMALKTDIARFEAKFDAGFSNLDAYLKRSESWHDEQVILRASHQRLKDTLVRKGVVSDSELAV